MRIAQRHLRLAVCILAITCFSPQVSFSSTRVVPVDFRKIAHSSKHIVLGTVTRMEIIRDPVTGWGLTKVTLGELSRVKGPTVKDSLQLTMLGGAVDGKEIQVAGRPIFHLGDRYILFLREGLGTKNDGYAPVMYGELGVFRVVNYKSGRASRVFDYYGRPVVRFGKDGPTYLPLEEPGAPPAVTQRSDSGARVGESSGQGEGQSSTQAIGDVEFVAALKLLIKDDGIQDSSTGDR